MIDFLKWATGRTPEAAWAECPRGDWLLEHAAKAGVDRRLLVLAAAACARLTLQIVPAGETSPLAVIEAAEAWTRSEVSVDGVRSAAERARDTYDAAHWAPCGGWRNAPCWKSGFYTAYLAAACAFLEGEELVEAAGRAAYWAASTISLGCSAADPAYAAAEQETARQVRVLIPALPNAGGGK